MTYWNSDAPVFAATNRKATIVAIMLAGADDTQRTRNYWRVRDSLRSNGLTVSFTGPIAIRDAVATRAHQDLLRTELISFPAILLLLVLVFRSLVAALLPVAVGGLTLAATIGLIRPLTLLTDVSVLAVNAVTVLCLALAVDAALFVVGRFREELTRSSTVDDAVVATVATAGRTVFFSCLTIGIVAVGLAFIPAGLTQSIGLCTAIAMCVGTVVCLTALPALLAVLGHRVNLGRLPLAARWRRPGTADRFWGRVGRAVIRRPVVFLVATVLTLVVLTMPFFHTRLGFPDQRALPADDPARVAVDDLRREFNLPALDLIQVVTRFDIPVDTDAGQVAVRAWAQRLRHVPGVMVVVTAASAGRHGVYYAYAGAAESGAAIRAVRQIRALPPPDGGAVLVGGVTAMAVDVYDLVRDRLPWVLLFIAAMTYLLLGVLLRSVLLPLKALIVNALSLGASFGALTWIFQDGHLTWLVGATRTGYLDVLLPVLLLGVLIGLSMDYELMLLSRIREHYDKWGDNDAAIIAGLRHSAPVFTAAALVVLVVAAIFATSDVVFVKQFCVGILVAVVVDATLVRAVLVPAAMRLLGKANWWLPRLPTHRPQ